MGDVVKIVALLGGAAVSIELIRFISAVFTRASDDIVVDKGRSDLLVTLLAVLSCSDNKEIANKAIKDLHNQKMTEQQRERFIRESIVEITKNR